MKIGNPRICSENEGIIRYEATVDLADGPKEVWLDVPAAYASWLCTDRADAFLVALVYYAMVLGEDVVCNAPVTEDLLYQIRDFIDVMATANEELHKIKVQASQLPAIVRKAARANVTGLSCGIDSFTTLAAFSGEQLGSMKLTHLIFNKIGAQGVDDDGKAAHDFRLDNARKCAEAVQLPLIETESNLHQVAPLKHLECHIYRNAFVILALQKGCSRYYYSSGYPLTEFNIRKYKKGNGFCELLCMETFSLPNLTFYSTASSLDRFQRTERVADFSPSYQFLNVCFNPKSRGPNCTVFCEKCRRTILALERAGKLHLYNKVFDLDLYEKNRQMVVRLACKELARGNTAYYKSLWSVIKRNSRLAYLYFAYYWFLNLFRRKR